MAFYATYNQRGVMGDPAFDRLCKFETREAYASVMQDPGFDPFWDRIIRGEARRRYPKAFQDAPSVIYTDYDMLDRMLEEDDGIDHWVWDDSHTVAFWTGLPR